MYEYALKSCPENDKRKVLRDLQFHLPNEGRHLVRNFVDAFKSNAWGHSWLNLEKSFHRASLKSMVLIE